MPTPPYSKLLVSVNGGGTQSGGITIATGDSIQLSLESTVGVVSQRWEIYEYPVAFTVPAGWTDAGDGTFYSTAATPSAFVCDEWGKYLLRVRINNDNSREDWLDESTALRAPSPNGLHDLAAKEENQFSAEDAWVADQKANLRVIEGKFAGGGDATSLLGIDLDTTSFGSPTDGYVLAYSSSGELELVSPSAGTAHVIQEEGTPLAARAALNVVGTYVTASDDAGNDATLLTFHAIDNADVDAAADIAVSKLAGSGSGTVLGSSGGTPTWTNAPALTAVQFGTDPASTGDIRTDHGHDVIVGFNAAEDTDIPLLTWGTVDEDDTLTLGDDAAAEVHLRATTSVLFALGANPAALLTPAQFLVVGELAYEYAGDAPSSYTLSDTFTTTNATPHVTTVYTAEASKGGTIDVTVLAMANTGSVAKAVMTRHATFALNPSTGAITELVASETIGTDYDADTIGGVSIDAVDDTTDSIAVTVTGKAATTHDWFLKIGIDTHLEAAP